MVTKKKQIAASNPAHWQQAPPNLWVMAWQIVGKLNRRRRMLVLISIVLLLAFYQFWVTLPEQTKGNILAGVWTRVTEAISPDPARLSSPASENAKHESQAKQTRAQDAMEKIREAHGYYLGGNIQGKQTALDLYRESLAKLPLAERQALDQTLLTEADQDFKGGHFDDALRKYDALFADYYRDNL